MRQRLNTGPLLPKELRDQVDDPGNRRKHNSARYGGPLNRKDRRKAERQAKKQQKPQKSSNVRHPNPPNARNREVVEDVSEVDWSDEDEEEEKRSPRTTSTTTENPVKSILKKDQPKELSPPPTVSRAVKERLAQDDVEIAALEKRLGIKGKKKSKGLDDGLEDLFGDLGGLDSDEEELFSSKTAKRKRDRDEEWLASKRRRALGNEVKKEEAEEESDQDSDDIGDMNEDQDLLSNEDEDDAPNEDAESEFSDSDGEQQPVEKPRVRENPYVAPVTEGHQAAKYIPPALRAPSSSADAEVLFRLRRQIQGLLNRLSDANIMTILRDVEQIYQNNARGYVTTTLIDLLIGLLADETVLIDTFLILHAGFIAAVYKVIGPDFGAQMVERIVSEFDRNYPQNKAGVGKHTTNLMSVVAELYCFQMIGSNLVFDYLRQFLDDLSEINTELLLRVVRVSGSQLRQDDPSSLKDIVLLLQKSVAQVGEGSLSVRTKFMIETINDLKNNKMKTGVAASAIVTEHTVKMKKQLGTLNMRNLKGTEPLRIGLTDVRNTDKKGKWWLVGASWRNDVAEREEPVQKNTQVETLDLNEDGEVDLNQLAREQRMNTDIRRAIFISIMSASDFKDAHTRLLKLNLKKAQEMEIPRIIVHCAGCENTYNPYYTLLAQKFCTDHRSRKCFQFALWDVFKSLGETKDGEEDDSSDEDEDKLQNDMSLRRLVNLGRLYGTLIAKDGLSITSLKPLNFPYIKPKTQRLIEVMLVTTILETQKSKGKSRPSKFHDEKALLNVFINVDAATEMIAGLQYFFKKVVSKSEITASKREKDTVKWACRAVMDMLERLMATTTVEDE
ncbi:hypothetical protein CC80DRAFT_521347 [Byssothecium circinans]|uniref:MI domain-containing protein n=1 Tax=Byssothecium circinans TaxID=147558 RepID=A0A6A5UH54_9PLEO|nr:hypothetical protein CC80DRAFT_521347 [Byssothecium circinans]